MTTETKAKGFYGWWLLFFLWVVYTIPIGFAFYSPMVLYPYMIQDIGWSRGEIMMGFTATMMLLGLTGPLTAWMLGRFGARATLTIGGLIVAMANFVMGLIGHVFPLYLAFSLLSGLGISFASVIPVQTVIISWFNLRRAMAMGLVLGGGAIGGFLAPQIVSKAVQAASGDWRIGWFIIAIASVIGMVVAILSVRNQPADMGQHPDGRPPREVKAGSSNNTTAKTYRTPVDWSLRDALRTSALWLLVVAEVFSLFLWHVVATQGPLHLQDRGFDPTMAAFFYSLAIGLSIVGRFTIAVLGDIIEPRFLFAFGALCILAGGVMFWFVSPDAMWMAYLYPLLAGFGFGVAYVCFPTITGNYWGAHAFAGITGLVSPVSMTVHALVAPLAGFLYDLQGTYLTVMVVSWVAGVVGLVAILLCKPPKPKDNVGRGSYPV